MSTSAKQQELHAMNVEEPTSKKESLSEKHPDFLPEQDNQLTSQYPFSLVKSVKTSIQNSFPKKWQNWTRIYAGLQDEIYD